MSTASLYETRISSRGSSAGFAALIALLLGLGIVYAGFQVRDELLYRLKQQNWTDFGSRNITVNAGVVHLWGLITSDAERHALTALAEGVPGVLAVRDEMFAIYCAPPAAVG